MLMLSAIPTRVIVAICCLAVAVTIAGPSGAQTALPHVKVLTLATDSGGQAYYALDLGYFKEAGLDVEVAAMSNGASVAASIASGGADIGMANLVSLAVARERGLPFVILSGGALYSSKSPTSALIVAKNSPIKSAADLIGKTVADQGVKDVASVAFDMWLGQQGVTASQVHIVEMPSPLMGESINRGTITAGVIPEPYLSRALANGARILAPVYTSIAPSFLLTAYFTSSGWADAHPDLARKFADAIAKAARWADNNRAQSGEILARYTKVPVSPTQVRVRYARSLDPAMLQPLIDAAVKDDVLKTNFPAAQLFAK